MPPLHHRAPGPVAACLAQAARGEAVLEVIGDGVHLDAGTVRMLFDVVGADGICLITDAMAASGMPEGTYALGGRDVVVAGRTARLADGGSIAGGVATLLEVVRWCVQDAGVPLQDAVRAASQTPARDPGPRPTSGRWRRGAGPTSSSWTTTSGWGRCCERVSGWAERSLDRPGGEAADEVLLDEREEDHDRDDRRRSRRRTAGPSAARSR